MSSRSFSCLAILLLATVLADIIGANGVSLARNKRYLGAGTNPNNIRVNVGIQQSFPTNNLGYNGRGNSGQYPVQNQIPLQSNQYANSIGGQLNSVGRGGLQQSVDTNNNGGSHESNVGIGGIQNFAGARGEAQIQKIVADSKNNGGSHQTNAGIGGLLLF